MRERRHLHCHLHDREGSGHAAACLCLSFPCRTPNLQGHCTLLGFKGLSPPSPAPISCTIDPKPIWGPKCSRQGWGHPELPCTPKASGERVQVPTAPSCSSLLPSQLSICPKRHLSEQIAGRFLLIPRSQPGAGSCSKQGGRLPQGLTPTGSPPQGLIPAVLSPEPLVLPHPHKHGSDRSAMSRRRQT